MKRAVIGINSIDMRLRGYMRRGLRLLAVVSLVGGLFLSAGAPQPVYAATSGTASVPYVGDNFNNNSGGNTGFTGNDGMSNWSSNWTEIGESDGAGSGDVIVESADRGRLRIRNANNGASRQVDLSSIASADYVTLAVEYRISTGSPFEADDYIDIDIDSGTGWVNLGSINGDGVGSSTYTRLTFDIKNYATSSTQIRFQTRSGLSSDDQVYFRYVDIQYPDSSQSYCYLVADGHNGSGNDLLTLVTKSGTEAAIGSTLGTSYVETIAFQPGTTTLYAANQTGSTGVFGTVDLQNGVFSQISPAGGIGTGSGSLGNITFNDVDSLAFAPFTGELYAVLRRGGSPNPPDILFQIDPATGEYVPDVFGTGVDYVVIPDEGNTQWQDIDDIAISSYDGTMYGVANASGSNDELVTIDKTTGNLTLVGVLGVNDMEGLAFDVEGNLFGTTGGGRSLYDIDVTSGVASNPRALREGSDYESADCLTWGTNDITGMVFEDANVNYVFDGGESGTAGVTVYLYRDVNGDGQVDAGDTLITSTDTDSNGNYSFGFPQGAAALGDFVMAIDTGDLPSGHTLTTDNLETAQFSTVGNSDAGNNFGHVASTSVGTVDGHLYMDDNGNGTQDAGEPDLANVDVVITNANGGTIRVTTDANGDWSAVVPPGSTTIDVDETDPDYPAGATQTEGNDPTTVTAIAGSSVDGGTDGYYVPLISVGDRVWLDLDGNGIQDAGEPGLENVIVELDNGTCTVGTDCPTQTTDSNGNYLFADLTPGTYTVLVRTGTLPGGVTQTGDPDTTVDDQHTLTGTAPNAYLSVDFGYQGTASIADYVWNDMNGDGVQDATEAGIGGVTVWVDLDNDGVQDTDEPSAVTATDGSYSIGGLPAGNYVVRTSGAPIGGATPTYDLDGVGTANVANVTLTAGGNRTDVDFGYQYSALSISKTSSAGGTVNPGDTMTYTIVVRNNTAAVQTGIAITDPLPAGTTFVTGTVTGYVLGSAEYRDDFNSGGGYSQSSGTSDWSGQAWAETGDDGLPTSGSIQIVSSNELQLNEPNGDSIARAIPDNFTGQTVLMDIDYREEGNWRGVDNFWVEMWDGSTWQIIIHENNDFDDPPAQTGIDIGSICSACLNATPQIRIRSDANGNSRRAFVDYVRLYYSILTPTTVSVNSPPNIIAAGSGFALDPGQSMTVTFQVAVNDPVALYSIDNTASVTSDQQSAPQSASTSDALPQPGAIGDHVWVDENGDGVQDAGEAGIPNARVTLTGTDYEGNAVSRVTWTGADGTYLFPDLLPGNYTVAVDAATLPANLAANPTYDYDGTASLHTTAVTLSSGQEMVDADFGYNWAPPADTDNPSAGTQGAIGDRLWIDADGDGVQDAGEAGLSGVTVRLYNDPDGDGVYDNLAGTTATDAAGNYVFDGLNAGAYVIEVNGGAPPAGYAQTGDPDQPGTTCTTCDNRTTAPLLLAPGDVYLNADFGYQLTGGGHTIGDTIFVDTNSSGSEDAGEPGIPGVSVALIRDTNGDGVWDPDGADNTPGTADDEPIIATDVTDGAGQYSFPGLPNAHYIVWANDTANVLGELTQTADPDATLDNRSAVNLAGGDNLAQDFGYAPPEHNSGEALIGDTIFIDRDGGNDYDPGEGVEGVVVHLYDATGTNLLASTTTDENGRYDFGGLSAGTYQIHVDTTTLPNGGSGLSNSVDPDGSNDSRATVTVAAGEVNLLQDFGYTMGSPNTISGTIWNDANADGTLTNGSGGTPDETGDGIGGVTVVLRDGDGNVVATTTTDANGDYSFTGLPDGTYTVDVTDDDGIVHGYWKSDGPNGSADNNSQDDAYAVVVSGGQHNTTADFGYYRDSATIGNFVWLDVNRDGIQDATEPGLSGVTVTLYITYPNGAGSVTLVTTTDENGNYTFDNLLFDEDYTATDGTATTPNYTIVVDAPVSLLPTTENAAGSTADNDSDGPNEDAVVAQGTTDLSYDFGFLTDPNGGIDLGDMPDTANLTQFGTGAAHVIFADLNDGDNAPEITGGQPAVWLGTIVDVEVDGTPTADTSGDGTDEDGVQVPATSSYWQTGETRSITITLNSDQSGVTVYYGLWIDWNGDADFDDPDDAFYSGSAVTGSPISVTVSAVMPNSYVYGTTVYFRARAFASAPTQADAGGTVINGEVEDYNGVYQNPTSVSLVTFNAEVQGDAIVLTWETASELDNVGFNVYRSASPDGPYARLNATLIPAQNPGSTFGAAYSWLDTDVQPGATYYYKLEDVDINGTATLNGPVGAAVAADPTAVDVQTFAAHGASLWAVLGLVTMAGSVALFRRRRS